MDSTAPGPDEIARLTQADPAAGLDPDAAALRAAVDARTSHVPDQLAAARSRRWTSWPARVAGIAAAALVVGGGGGYAIGAAGGQPELAAAAITLTTGPSGDAASSGAPGSPEAMAVPDAGLGGAARTADMSFWGGWGRTVFTSSGLSDEGGSHAAWALDAASVFSDATVAAAAAALGVAGSPEMTYGAWSVGATDGTGPVVTLSADGTASLGYYDPTTDPWSCTAVTEESAVEPEPCEQRDLGPAPQGEDAMARLRALLGSLGQDAASFELVAEDYGDVAYSYVTAYQVIDGQRTGLAWSASFTGAGLQSLYGSLARVVEIGEYEVISPVEAVERLGDPRFGFGWGGPIAYADGATVREGDAVQSVEPTVPTVPATVTAGSRLSWPVTEVTIVSARLGVALHTQVDGAAVLAPTYELTSADGGIWTVLAVADAALDFSAAG